MDATGRTALLNMVAILERNLVFALNDADSTRKQLALKVEWLQNDLARATRDLQDPESYLSKCGNSCGIVQSQGVGIDMLASKLDAQMSIVNRLRVQIEGYKKDAK